MGVLTVHFTDERIVMVELIENRRKQLIAAELVGRPEMRAMIKILAVLVNHFGAKTVEGVNSNLKSVFADNLAESPAHSTGTAFGEG